MHWLIFLGIGALSGWLAGRIMRGGGFGLLNNCLLGVVGSAAGGYLFSLAGLSTSGGLIGSIVTATVGAIALLSAIRLIKSV